MSTSNSTNTTDSEDEHIKEIPIKSKSKQENILFALSQIENANDELRKEIYNVIKNARNRNTHPYHKLFTFLQYNYTRINIEKDHLTLEECRSLINIMLKSMIFLSFKSDILYYKESDIYYNDILPN
ncbi:hypothetical protein CHREV_268 [Choristoneura rosaceana entomopoxvirus 'L']|uniref:Uncharacterized protein n=1 Tax=Choristoneura rosaceana entomopoxvirus 'L' TaxID=1293539 RepID=A0ABM9QKV3_9POXV|nr:hypothetical protein CHREV_268 [Choristoneura rosaceana entomopoxvirus 'L']CCU56170.1 hypothetical protein CHREV_268 [Choristoneura rosaceana entomopoxvirus 'L']